ncbi:hypothetical protein [Bifidobacterium felsineum]|uniref:hypothetical protein n=1 Tax=Bifidobacterium felsineum TaxID=2045440 RepID=UPI001BDD4F2E|nr:hypothetical protein [Bifidobacterium felsineum]MBT1164560.1 hypothetical protein [Bifidobacterium felsineum]
MVPESQVGVKAAERARRIRAEALIRMRRQAEQGDFAHALADLIRDAQTEPALLRLHIWRVEQAFMDNRTAACKRHARLAAEWNGATRSRAGSLTLAWLLHEQSGGARLAAWLLAIGLDVRDRRGRRVFTLSGPDPYHRFRSAGEDAGGRGAEP